MALKTDGSEVILNGATATGAGSAYRMIGGGRATVSAYGTTSSGSGSASITIYVSNSGNAYISAGTISLTLGTTAVEDGFAIDAAWTFIKADVTAISGTGATVSVIISA